jgi:hypothetical protein
MTRQTSSRTESSSGARSETHESTETRGSAESTGSTAPSASAADAVPPGPARPRLLLGAYALAPGDPAGEATFLAGLDGLGVQALEMPLPAHGTAAETARWARAHLPEHVDLVVTAVPRTMQRLASDPGYGLSSADLAQRRAALDDLAVLRDLARRLADDAGRPRLAAVELHSAPGPGLGTLTAFRESLDEVLAWDLGGAHLLVEHCDALVEGQPPAKGFWPLHEEIAVLQAIVNDVPGSGSGSASRLGVSINWGRSAIEGRSARTPVEHVRAAAEAGLLRAVVFSGASASDTPWGPAWGDQHIAPRGSDPALEPSAGSLLGAAEILETLQAARGATLEAVGIKVTARPEDADVEERLAVARASLRMVSEALRGGSVGRD